jgi:hypothetical protein
MIHNISQHFKINVYHCLSYLMRTNNVATQAKMEKQIKTWKQLVMPAGAVIPSHPGHPGSKSTGHMGD